MKKVLLLSESEATSQGLDADLKGIGLHAVGAVRCDQLVQSVIRLGADLVLGSFERPGEELFAATSLLETAQAVPVAIFTQDARVESMERALRSGVHLWVVRGYDPERLRPALQLAGVRFRHEQERRGELGRLARRLEERKLVDRAKGILMAQAGLPEDEAFRTLRSAAMQGQERLGAVASRLIEAAGNAESVNRAGQLRMLSQRLVKLRALIQMNLEPESALALSRLSSDRVERNLAALARWMPGATYADLLEACIRSWDSLKSILGDTVNASLTAVDAAAERLLEDAERLTAALETASATPNLQLVNLAGRQRMWVQRAAKFALLDAWSEWPANVPLKPATEAAQRAFEAAMPLLRQAPLADEAALRLLDRAQQCWSELCREARAPGTPEARRAIARTSEELIDLFDRLTERFEHHTRVLVG